MCRFLPAGEKSLFPGETLHDCRKAESSGLRWFFNTRGTILFMEAGLGLPGSSWTCFDLKELMEQRVLDALKLHCSIKTQTDGPWQKNKTSD